MKLRTLILFPEEYKDTTYKGVCYFCSHKVFKTCDECTFANAMRELYVDIDDTLKDEFYGNS